MRARVVRSVKASFDEHHERERRRTQAEYVAKVTAHQLKVFQAGTDAATLHRLAKEEPKAARTKPAPRVTVPVINNTMQALQGQRHLDHAIEKPSWVGEGDRRSYVAFVNGLVDLDGLLRGEAELLPHTRDWFSDVCLPYEFTPGADCPGWKSFVERALEGDADRIALLQEWLGYNLISTTDLQKFAMFHGEAGTGKSTALAGMTAVVGEENVSSVPLEDFGKDFALAQTLGKLANISSEIGELDKTAEGQLKQIVDGSLMAFNRKHKDIITARRTVRLTFATNNLPRFHDRSDGVWRRLLLIPFRVRVNDEEKVVGMDKPGFWYDSGEVPGMLLWAVAGLRRLREGGHFTRPAVCHEELAKYREESNPARLFLGESCERAGEREAYVESAVLYREYREWCAANGYQPLGNRQFGREVSRAFGVERKQIGGRQERTWVYLGLRFYHTPPAHARSKPLDLAAALQDVSVN
jgi:P4 family phage/plasmid primase-like protien